MAFKKKKILFPILPVYKTLVPQVTETLMFVSLFNLHFTCFLPFLPSGQLDMSAGVGAVRCLSCVGGPPFPHPALISPFLFAIQRTQAELKFTGQGMSYLFNCVAQQNLM